ncbi:hypothetical protein AW736_11545 [Termitidicoccus mucosus]|uniref:Ig-like domain-containing protein n=2 Tax=Termitidicoccus mucosus TaxID=1184151 RepID=A0A178IL02_9BACT|nr:hypothetical protein AW736_11545 [Opitutaceae bacterium TSB47]
MEQSAAAAGESAEATPTGGAVSPWELTGKVADAPAPHGTTTSAMEIDLAAAHTALPAINKGDFIDFDLGGGKQMRGKVNMVAIDDSSRHVGGTMTGHERAGFFLSLDNGDLSGLITLRGEKLAYTITTGADGRGWLRQVPIGKVMCVQFPLMPGGQSSKGAASAPIEIPLRNSRENASGVLYLDFDGETVTDTNWNSEFNDGNPIVARSFALTADEIVHIWNVVSEDFRPFNVNVTTDVERFNSAPKNKRMRCIFTPDQAWIADSEGLAGGWAYLNSFSANKDEPCWAFNDAPYTSMPETASHELGHTFGLGHDGGPGSEEYYSGHADNSWGAIMGAAFTARIVQWSKGEYEGANNHEDDIAIIGDADNGVGFTADGIGGGRFDATTIPLTSGSTFSQSAVLLGDTDVNMHRLTLPGAAGSSYYTVAIHARPAAVAADAKLSFEVQPFFYGLPAIATAGDPDSPEMDARIESLTLEGGSSYYLQVRGIGYAGSGSSAASSGFTAYGSAGEYTLEGTFIAYTKPVELQRLPVATDGVRDFDVTLAAVADGYPKAQITWEMSPDGGTTWILLGNGEIPPHGGTYVISEDGARLVISGLTPDMNAYQYRCTATNVIDTVSHSASSVTTLRVVESLVPSPVSLARDGTGTLYVADDKLHAIRTIAPAASGTFHVGSYAGETEAPGLANGAGGEARFNSPSGIAITPARDLYVADSGNHQIRLVTHAGTLAPSVTTFAGASASGLADGDAAATARFTSPGDVAVATGTVYVADTLNHAIRVIAGGTVTTLFGADGEAGWADGDAAGARLNQPSGIVVTDSGEIYVADTGNHVIRKIDSGTLATIAGLPGEAAFSDGAGFDAHFNRPMGLAFRSGTLYVADCENSAIRTVFTNSTGNYEAGTLAGDPLEPTRADGTAAQARFKYPRDIIAGVDGHLYVADTGNAAIRKIEPDHQNRISTLELKQQPPPEPPPPPTTGGNGSAEQSSTGGGAPSPWLLLAFAALAGLRFVRPRR